MAARKLHETGWIRRNETVVLFNTGAAVKYNHLLRCDDALKVDHKAADVLDRLEGIR
jgi:threonine synthase